MYILFYLKLEFKLLLELPLEFKSKFKLPWRVAKAELLVVEVEDAYYIR